MHILQSFVSDFNHGKDHHHTCLSIYDECIEGEHFRMAFLNDGKMRAYKSLKIKHSDVFGHMRNVLFIDNCTSSRSDLEICPSGRNKAPMMVGMSESSKSP